MKKPTEAIERMRRVWGDDLKEVLAYLDSIPEWPADLTRERLEELADEAYSGWSNRFDALSRLAAIAPKRGKRKVDLWWHDGSRVSVWDEQSEAKRKAWIVGGWRKVGGAEIDA